MAGIQHHYRQRDPIEVVGYVAGLAAKPVVDIQVSVADLSDESRYVPQLETTGMQLRSRDQLHRYLRPFAGQPREAQVHVCALGSTWEYEQRAWNGAASAARR